MYIHSRESDRTGKVQVPKKERKSANESKLIYSKLLLSGFVKAVKIFTEKEIEKRKGS